MEENKGGGVDPLKRAGKKGSKVVCHIENFVVGHAQNHHRF